MRRSFIVVAVVLVALFAAAAAASADIATFNGVGTGSQVASNTANPVKVQAEVKPKITLAIETPAPSQVVTFGAVYPGTAVPSQLVSLTVELNSFAKTANRGEGTLGKLKPVDIPNRKGQALRFRSRAPLGLPDRLGDVFQAGDMRARAI